MTPGTSENIRVDASCTRCGCPAPPTAYIECEFHDNATTAKWIVEHTVDIGEDHCPGICDYFGVTFKAPEKPKPAATTDKLYRGAGGCICRPRQRGEDAPAAEGCRI